MNYNDLTEEEKKVYLRSWQESFDKQSKSKSLASITKKAECFSYEKVRQYRKEKENIT